MDAIDTKMQVSNILVACKLGIIPLAEAETRVLKLLNPDVE